MRSSRFRRCTRNNVQMMIYLVAWCSGLVMIRVWTLQHKRGHLFLYIMTHCLLRLSDRLLEPEVATSHSFASPSIASTDWFHWRAWSSRNIAQHWFRQFCSWFDMACNPPRHLLVDNLDIITGCNGELTSIL